MSGGAIDYNPRSALGIAKEIEAAGCRIEPLPEVAPHADRLHALYLQVLENARVRPAAVEPGFFPALAAALGPAFRCLALRQGEKILGFVTLIRDGETAVGYYLGFDRGASAEIPIYLRLLQAVVADAIALGCRRLSLGRTALEPKARLGASPRPLRVWIRHRIPALNLLVRNFIKVIHHDEPPERGPFK